VKSFLEELSLKLAKKDPIDLGFGNESIELKQSNNIAFLNYKKFDHEKKQVE
jgi:hypothetical protein